MPVQNIKPYDGAGENHHQDITMECHSTKPATTQQIFWDKNSVMFSSMMFSNDFFNVTGRQKKIQINILKTQKIKGQNWKNNKNRKASICFLFSVLSFSSWKGDGNKKQIKSKKQNYFASSDPHHGIQFIPSDNLSGISIWHSIWHVF